MHNMRLQLRADAFNPFNRTNFAVNGTAGNFNFGRATGPQYGPRSDHHGRAPELLVVAKIAASRTLSCSSASPARRPSVAAAWLFLSPYNDGDRQWKQRYKQDSRRLIRRRKKQLANAVLPRQRRRVRQGLTELEAGADSGSGSRIPVSP